MLADSTLSSYLAWAPQGDAFHLLRPEDFARDIMPLHFKTSSIKSFVRQLHHYRFKVSKGRAGGPMVFKHALFRRDCHDDLFKLHAERTVRNQPAPADASLSSEVSDMHKALTTIRESTSALASKLREAKAENAVLRQQVADAKSAQATLTASLASLAAILPALRGPGSSLDFESLLSVGDKRPRDAAGDEPPAKRVRREVVVVEDADDDLAELASLVDWDPLAVPTVGALVW